jgi:transcriptional regulator with XRE-family HTH domain
MPKSRLQLPPLKLAGKGSLGGRIARIRKERGLTQVELAERVGIIQALISDYERDNRRLHADMIVRVAQALGVSTDELLGVKAARTDDEANLRLSRRLKGIEALPVAQQKVLLKTIDTFLKGAGQ